MKKSILVIGTFIIIGFISSAFFTPGPYTYQNLHVLPKDINEHDMDSIMGLYQSSLGVGCGFCHVENMWSNSTDFASDVNKHKLVAREMMKMTDSINKIHFPEGKGTSQAITCYSCHHGHETPPRFAPRK